MGSDAVDWHCPGVHVPTTNPAAGSLQLFPSINLPTSTTRTGVTNGAFPNKVFPNDEAFVVTGVGLIGPEGQVLQITGERGRHGAAEVTPGD